MKRLAAFAATALVVALLPAAAGTAGAGVANPASVTIVHAATYQAGPPPAPFVVTLCLDGALVDGSFEATDILGPLDIAAGTHQVDIFVGADQACVEGDGDISEEVDLAAGDDVTLAAVWISTGQGPSLAVWPNDNSCLDPGTARVTARHGAYTNGPVDIDATVGGTQTTLFADLAEGAQDSIEVPAGTVAADVTITPAAPGEPIAVGDLGPFLEGNQYIVYAFGGADGDVGVFVDVVEEALCAVPPSSVPVTTAAAAAAVSPRFTG